MIRLATNGQEWTTAEVARLQERNVLIDVAVAGSAEAAGISFGDFKDFLAPVSVHHGERRLQLEIDGDARTWAFRVDGVLMGREWWDAAVHSADDLVDRVLIFKARHADEIEFRDLAIRPLESSTRVSVIMTCYRFAQRLRVALRNWCHQQLPSGALEVIVVNPESPDGTHEQIAAAAAAYPEVRVREIAMDAGMARNKGYLLNRAVEIAQGEWIWFTDADCVFAPDAAAHVLRQVTAPQALFFGERRHLTRRLTDLIIAGRRDAAADFPELLRESGGCFVEAFPWGYSQILHRTLARSIRYTEDVDNFSTSDGAFVEECRRRGVAMHRVDGLVCLHLSHPFAWYGTDVYL